MGTVRFSNDHFTAITGYGDYIQGNLTICNVYYVEGIRHNIFLVGQFCDGDLKVAFRSNTYYVQNLEGKDLLIDSHDSNLYIISISKMAASSPVFLIKDLVDGLLKFKYDKDHLCPSCEQGKSKNAISKPKLVPSTHSKLEMIHTDLCGPMRVEIINGNRYIMNMRVQILKVWLDNSKEFKNEKLRSHYEKLGIMHQTSIARMPRQNGVVERRNKTLVKAARTMLILSKALEFLWAEAISTASFT
ncbi:retrovirus-related pol polyprotein from transposon TNT 1-94 [Tanacetum coccineum]